MKQSYPVLNAIGLAGVLVINYLAVALPLNGNTPGEISDMFPTLFTPAGFTFGIWSVIYLLLLIFVVRQIVFLFRKDKAIPPSVQLIGPLFFISCLLNMAWLFAWHHLLTGISFLIMLGILTTLILIYRRLRVHSDQPVHWTSTLPFSIYLGWITVATIANATILLYDAGWNGFGASEAFWAAAMIGAGTIIGGIVLFRHKDIAFGLVLAWAFFGIYSKRSNALPIETTVTFTALAAIAILVLISVYMVTRKLN